MTNEKKEISTGTPRGDNVLRFADEIKKFNPNVSVISMLYLKYQISLGINEEAVKMVADELGIDYDDVYYWIEESCEEYETYNKKVAGDPIKRRGSYLK